MKIFIDTANVEDIKKANDLGVIHPLTTAGIEKFLKDYEGMNK